MRASEIRNRFLKYFQRNDHVVRPSSSLVPGDDPTLLFTNAGMVQFKRIFLGLERSDFGTRATTSQKCVRAGGKHNDLEQVGHTARHHTFFEMLGNFSFGEYFKRDAIRLAWEFLTGDLGIDPALLRVTVHESDQEARALWRETALLPESRIYGLGDSDNFWQMADTGPCGPCSEIYVDLARATKDWRFPDGASGEWTDLDRAELSRASFIEGAEGGRFLEIWNLVFMQYDRQPDGTLIPLPKPSVDTGAGLERIASVMQRVTSNYHTDLFEPLIETVERYVGITYWGRESDETRNGVSSTGGIVRLPDGTERPGAGYHVRNAVDPASFRVLADHARAVAFLLADGVFPSNDGRGYVLRRILRRAVRHAWLLGRHEPTLVHVVQAVIDTMGDVYPELRGRASHLLETTRVEEHGFLTTIDGGLSRFDQIAPMRGTRVDGEIHGTVSGEDAFKLYDTYGFPIDLTELMARERGYVVDIPGFERALDAQRRRSQDERKAKKVSVRADESRQEAAWETPAGGSVPPISFVGYDTIEIETEAMAITRLEIAGADAPLVAVLLRESPFYAESGGQVADRGEIIGDGWRVDVEDVRKIDGRSAAVGRLTGHFHFGHVLARVPSDRRRDTERNHTATHLLHAALRHVLGDQVHQAGSLVAPDRLRFDCTHHGPIAPDRLSAIEAIVNQGIWRGAAVVTIEKPYAEARASGAMALFGEKYGDVVRVVEISGLSLELCGGTHVRNTGEIGLFKIISETGVAAGVRRIEALTGPGAYQHVREQEEIIRRVSAALKVPATGVDRRVMALLEERRAIEQRLAEMSRVGGDQLETLMAGAKSLGTTGSRHLEGIIRAADVKALQSFGDTVRERLGSGVGVLGASFGDGKHALLVVVTDDLRERGVRADHLIKPIAAAAGGRGGGKPHMAQAGIPDADRFDEAFAAVPGAILAVLGSAA